MAEKGGKGKGVKRKNKKTSKKHSLYVIEGGILKRKNVVCPKCGPGIFMASHKDRICCGKCGYTEKRIK